MNKKSFVFAVAIALTLVGCSKEKEEAISTIESTEQQLPTSPSVAPSNTGKTASVAAQTASEVPAAVPPLVAEDASATAPVAEQNNAGVTGQQQVVPQAPQEAVLASDAQTQPQLDQSSSIPVASEPITNVSPAMQQQNVSVVKTSFKKSHTSVVSAGVADED